MSTAFTARSRNPMYVNKTDYKKCFSGITKQNGSQNVIYKESPVPLTKELYTQNFKTHYKKEPVLSKKSVSGPYLQTEPVVIRKDFNIFTGEENSGPYINQKVRTSGVGALGVFAEGNLENPSYGDSKYGIV